MVEKEEKEIWEKNIASVNSSSRFIQRLKFKMFGVKKKHKTIDDVNSWLPSGRIMIIFCIVLGILMLDLLIRLGMDVYTFFNPPVDPTELSPKITPILIAITSIINGEKRPE